MESAKILSQQQLFIFLRSFPPPTISAACFYTQQLSMCVGCGESRVFKHFCIVRAIKGRVYEKIDRVHFTSEKSDEFKYLVNLFYPSCSLPFIQSFSIHIFYRLVLIFLSPPTYMTATIMMMMKWSKICMIMTKREGEEISHNTSKCLNSEVCVI